ncbi:MAG: response regulator [Deferribacteres bacterium]|nr:response regulator [candidate division KSB1 bacterium]MCB9508651.1 response regulator [Deferribacteres bacterium]
MSEPKTHARILIVDDEEIFRETTARLLTEAGYACDTASNSEAGVNLLQNNTYYLTISDIKMPGNDELAFIDEIAKIARDMPVILVTGYPSAASAIKSIHLPVVAYLVKPFSYAELLEQVSIAISSYQSTMLLNQTIKQFQNLQQQLASASKKSVQAQQPEQSVQAFLALTLQNVFGSLLNIKNLTETLAGGQPQAESCQLLQCPRQLRLRQAIEESIDVLIETKDFCKSRKLGELRKKLEAVLKNENRDLQFSKK